MSSTSSLRAGSGASVTVATASGPRGSRGGTIPASRPAPTVRGTRIVNQFFNRRIKDSTRRETIGSVLGSKDGLAAIGNTSKSGRFTPLFLPQEVKAGDRDLFLGTASAHARHPDIRVVDAVDASKLVLKLWDVDAVAGVKILGGKDTFTKADAEAKYARVVPYLKGDDDTEYVVHASPVSIIFEGKKDVPHGKDRESTRPMLEEHSLEAAVAHDAHVEWSAEEQAALIAERDNMGTCFPRLSDGATIADSPYVSTTKVDDDLEEILHEAIEKLNAELGRIVEADDAARAGEERAAADAASASMPVPRRLVTPGRSGSSIADDEDASHATATTVVTGARQAKAARILLALGCLHPDGSTVSPTISEDGEQILEETNKTYQLQLYMDSLRQSEMRMSQGGTAVAAAVNLPPMAKACVGMFLNGSFETEPIKDFQTLPTRAAFTILFLLSQGGAARRAVSSADRDRLLQECVGEDTRKMSKLSTTFTAATDVDGLSGLQTFLANVMAFASAMCRCSPEELKARGVAEGAKKLAPFIHNMAKEFHACVTTIEVRRRIAETEATDPHVVTSIAHWADVIGAGTFKAATLSQNVRGVVGGDWGAVTEYLGTMQKYLQRRLDEIVEWGQGGDPIKPSSLWTTSGKCRAIVDAEKRRSDAATQAQIQKAAELLSRKRKTREEESPRVPKQPRTAGTSGVIAEDLAGDILFSGDSKERMVLPRITNQDEAPCAAYYRHGSRCRRPGCRFSHVPIDELTPESQKEWLAHVKGRKELSFNPARVKFAVATMQSATAAGGEQVRVAAAAALAGKKPATGKK